MHVIKEQVGMRWYVQKQVIKEQVGEIDSKFRYIIKEWVGVRRLARGRVGFGHRGSDREQWHPDMPVRVLSRSQEVSKASQATDPP